MDRPRVCIPNECDVMWVKKKDQIVTANHNKKKSKNLNDYLIWQRQGKMN